MHFQQTAFKKESGCELLMLGCLATQIHDLIGGGGSSHVARKPLLSGFQKLFGSAIARQAGDTLALTRCGDAIFTAPALNMMQIISSAKD